VAATVEMTDAGMVKTADDGTDDGTFDDWITANPFDDKRITWVDGNEATTEVATMTGDDQTDGIVTDDGTVKVTIALDGTVWTRLDGTYDGTSDDWIKTADGDDPIGITTELGSDETNEAGTTTGDEKVAGTVTNDGT
jgi:hypothetical protein